MPRPSGSALCTNPGAFAPPRPLTAFRLLAPQPAAQPQICQPLCRGFPFEGWRPDSVPRTRPSGPEQPIGAPTIGPQPIMATPGSVLFGKQLRLGVAESAGTASRAATAPKPPPPVVLVAAERVPSHECSCLAISGAA